MVNLWIGRRPSGRYSGRMWARLFRRESCAVGRSCSLKSLSLSGQGGIEKRPELMKERTDMGIGEIGELLRRSTVHIRNTDSRRQSAGSGVIWDSLGTIITNAHVLSRGTSLVE